MSNYSYYYNGADPTNPMESMELFSNNEHTIDLSTLDPNKVYCIVANLHGSLGFSYKWVVCDDINIKAIRLCFRDSIDCSSTAKRKKRQIEKQKRKKGEDKATNDKLESNSNSIPNSKSAPDSKSPPVFSVPEEITLDNVFVTSKRLEIQEKAKQASLAYQTSFQFMDLKKSYPSLFEILWYTQLPCFDVEGVTSDEENQYGLLKGCFWKDMKVPCSRIFKTFPTNQGMCCTFNMDSAEKMFQIGKYQDRVSFMQERDKNLSFDR